MPARFRDILQLCASYGITAAPAGKHWKLEKPGFRCYPIPAHNGERTEIIDIYIRGLCRNFEIDYATFKKAL